MGLSIEVVKKVASEFLFRLPNVVGVGIGEKDGVETIRVYVSHKVPESQLKTEEKIPEEINGYRTQVIEVGQVVLFKR